MSNVDSAGPRCPECGYSVRGLRRPRCPECGQTFAWREVGARSPRLAWRVAAFDLPGLIVTAALNVAIVIALAVAVLGFRKSGWFTDARLNVGPRGPQSVSAWLQIVLALSLAGWGWAWGLPERATWTLQRALAIWCWLLTLLHLAGLLSVLR